VNAWDTLN